MHQCGHPHRCPTSPRLSAGLPLALLECAGARTSLHTHTAIIILPGGGPWQALAAASHPSHAPIPCLQGLQVPQESTQHTQRTLHTAARMEGNPLGLGAAARSTAVVWLRKRGATLSHPIPSRLCLFLTSPISHILALDPAGHTPHRGPLPVACSVPFSFPSRAQCCCCCAVVPP